MLTPNIKQRISSTYASHGNKNVELEARFGRSTIKGFVPGVTRQTFNRIREYFTTKAHPVQTKTTDYISGDIRKTVTTPLSSDTSPETIWIKKTRLWNQEDNNYGIRYSMSKELPISPVERFNPKVIREKNRWSFMVFGGTVRVDLTMVNMVQGLQKVSPQKDQTRYEVEVELVHPQALSRFEKASTVTLQLVLDTILLYTNREASAIISYVNRMLGSTKRGIVDHYPLVQARNLKLKDMVWGGLIGNPETGYSVTHKADGNRKLLVFHETGTWLVMSPHSLNRITRKPISTLVGTILDGEMIPLNRRKTGAPNSKIWFLAFDCIAWNGDTTIQRFPHGKRMNHAQVVADVNKSELLYVNTKTFRNFTTPQEFFKTMRDMFREQELLAYEQDGFMFTPVNTVYNPHSDYHPLYKRVLTKYPDICKWKPKEQLTIDFQIRWKATPGGTRQIQLYVNEKGSPVLFTGTKIFPYTGTVDHNHPMTQSLPGGTIVEYGWDYEKELLVPHRVRHDKSKPNKIKIAEDVWMDISRPLDRETMEGKSFKLLRSYHNRIKKDLFNEGLEGKEDKEGLEKEEGRTLLDIGSGRGGDVSKWRRYSKIVAVEPNPEHVEELKRRIALHGLTDRVRIVNTGGEDIETIYRNVREFIGGRVDVVSLMLSMSFFWRSQSMVNRLINTITSNIKRDGKLVFLTIDGDLVEQTFEPAMNTGPVLDKLELGPAVLTYYSDRVPKELHIDIEGTIVKDQVEWLVRLGDLIMPLRKMGFDFAKRQRADEERFLTEEEITMTQMYTYAVVQTVDTPEGKKELPELQDVIPGKEKPPGLKTDPSDIPLPVREPILPFTEELPSPGLPPPPKLPSVGLPSPGLPSVPKLPPAKLPSPGLPPAPKLPSVGLPSPGLPPAPARLPSARLPPLVSPARLPPPRLPSVGLTLPKLLPPGLSPVPKLPSGLPPMIPVLVRKPEKEPEKKPEKEEPEGELPMIPMDTFQEVVTTWYDKEKVVRIGAIGDGSCFFHSVINGYYKPYQNNDNRKQRSVFVKKLRRDIAYTLQMKNPENNTLTMWETAANGIFKELYEQQMAGLEMRDMFGNKLDYSLEGLQRLLNSDQYLGDEVYQYASDILGIDIYVMRLTNKNLYPHLNTSKKGVERKVVVISGNGNHYETIGVERDGLFQTVFSQDDPFIKALKLTITDIGGAEVQLTEEERVRREQQAVLKRLERQKLMEKERREFYVTITTKALTDDIAESANVHTKMVGDWGEMIGEQLEVQHKGTPGDFYTKQNITKEEYNRIYETLGSVTSQVKTKDGKYVSTLSLQSLSP